MSIPTAHAAPLAEHTRQKHAAEAEHAELQQKLAVIRRDILKTETTQNHVADVLSHSEKAISEVNRTLHDLARKQLNAETNLQQLSEKHVRLNQLITVQKNQLAMLLRGQYITSNEDRFKLLLSEDNPNRLNRELHYWGYLSQAQAKLIESLRTNLASTEDNRTAAADAKKALEAIAQEQNAQKKRLEKEKTRRMLLLTELSNKLAAQRKEAGNIERDQRRLSLLVDKLSNLIAEQRKADAAKTKLQKPPQAAAVKEKSRQPTISSHAINRDESPSKIHTQNELASVVDVQSEVFTPPFSSLRGRLRLPVQGELVAKFGSSQGEGPTKKGMFIRAAEGAEIRTVADGRVVFAEWLRGFGNLVIIDHGNQYMTIYGNNQTLLKQAEDVVKTGEIIANAGNSGGNEQSGLYFEIRHQGRAFDPLAWMTKTFAK